MKGFAIQRFVEQGDCLMNNEWLPWKKWKPETGRVIGRPSAPLFFFQKPLPKSIIESSSCKISQNSVKNARGRSLFWLQGINLHIYRNWIVQHIFFGILKQLFPGMSSINCCTSVVSSTIIFQIHTELLLPAKLSLYVT